MLARWSLYGAASFSPAVESTGFSRYERSIGPEPLLQLQIAKHVEERVPTMIHGAGKALDDLISQRLLQPFEALTLCQARIHSGSTRLGRGLPDPSGSSRPSGLTEISTT